MTKKKAHGEVRQSQLITTFGPGALLDLPRYSVIVAGLDGIQADVVIQEPRLLTFKDCKVLHLYETHLNRRIHIQLILLE
jgi:hypothetical protein